MQHYSPLTEIIPGMNTMIDTISVVSNIATTNHESTCTVHSQYATPHPLNPQSTGNMLPMAQCYITHREVGNEKRPLNPFPGKDEIEYKGNFGKL